jgi:8-oxo-dGTP pyrophosphatase MutT (NUDIX family)
MALVLNQETVETAPRDASTVMVLRDGTEGLEVLLMRRHANSPVLGGAYAFPGGKVDTEDRQFPPDLINSTDFQLQQELAEDQLPPAMARAIWVAAVRETFEECGLFLGVGQHDDDLNFVSSGGESFAQLVRTNKRVIQANRLTPWTRWITPKRPSVTNKRFDSRIFIAVCSTSQAVRADGHEMTEVVWIRPRQAIQRYADGDMDMAPVQLICLAHLQNFSNADQVVRDARGSAPRLIEPLPIDQNGQRIICYPGDPLHAEPTSAWNGPTRLIHRQGRFEPVEGIDSLLQ